MDEYPGGLADAETTKPALSVVVPVRNGGLDFERCLRGLKASIWSDYELLVVDDGSTDDTAARAVRHGARVIRHAHSQGPAASRNDGARAARSELVFFLDADVVVHPGTLGEVIKRFQEDPGLAALFGSYDDQPAASGLVSQFRNLMHHYVHQQGIFQNDSRPAHTFWTGCGAVRREIFQELGGFDPKLYRKPAIEDIELGYRFTRAGHRIALVRSIQATHLKRWTLGLMVKTDIFQRGVPWMLLLMLSGRQENDLNVGPSQRICVAATGLGWIALLLAPWFPVAALFVILAVLSLVAGFNQDFYRFLNARRGFWFAAGCVPLHLVYYSCCGVSVAIALTLRVLLEKEPERARAEARWRPVDVPSFPRPRLLQPRRPNSGVRQDGSARGR